MLPRNNPDRIQITFDDHRLVANAELLLPTTLAPRLGLPQLVQECLDLVDAPGRANTSDKMMTLVASALAGGDCIDDADVLRTGGTARTLGGTDKAPSTLGTSCVASGGAMSASWIGWAASCWPKAGTPDRRQLDLPRLTSNQMFMNFDRTRLLADPLRQWKALTTVVSKARCNAKANTICPCVAPSSSVLLIPALLRARVIT